MSENKINVIMRAIFHLNSLDNYSQILRYEIPCTNVPVVEFSSSRWNSYLIEKNNYQQYCYAHGNYIFLQLLRRFNPAEPVVEKSVIL